MMCCPNFSASTYVNNNKPTAPKTGVVAVVNTSCFMVAQRLVESTNQLRHPGQHNNFYCQKANISIIFTALYCTAGDN